jgi:hypothetical protein
MKGTNLTNVGSINETEEVDDRDRGYDKAINLPPQSGFCCSIQSNQWFPISRSISQYCDDPRGRDLPVGCSVATFCHLMQYLTCRIWVAIMRALFDCRGKV